MSERERTLVVERPEQLWGVDTRRGFLKMLGLGGSIVLLPSVFAACSDKEITATGGGTDPVTLNLSNDFGILNYAFALEQLEAAFYTAVLGSTAFAGMSAEQKEVFTDLRNHEVIHREFFRAALGSNKIGDLALNQSTVNTAIASTASILQNAELFEDLGVAAYNGAGKYLTNADYLTIAGKIVSVEARHAAAIRDLREAAGTAGTPAGARFAGDDVVQPSGTYQGLDVKLEPGAVLAKVVASNTVSTTITTSGLPTKTGTPDAFPS
jgi:rubrerythrin